MTFSKETIHNSIQGIGIKIADFVTTGFKTFFKKYREGLLTLLFLCVISICIVLPTWVTHYFMVPLGGDYSLQSMTFNYLTYDMWHEFFRTGQFPLWDNKSFLGMDNIGGNSFYMLFDPWYLILLIFPRSWQMTLQGLSFPFKMVVGGMGMYMLLKEFKLKYTTCRLFSLGYAFCGWMMMYFWFQFMDSGAFIPFVFLGIEKILREKDVKAGLISIFLLGLCNYFMLFVTLLGGFIYAIFRLIQMGYKDSRAENIQKLGLGFATFILPTLAVAFILVPSFFQIIGMPRVADASYLDKLFGQDSFWDMIKQFFTFDAPENQVYPLSGFLFMPVGCFYQNIGGRNGFDNFTQSTFISTPLQLITFYSIVEAFRKRKPSYIIGVLFVAFMMFTPFCYYLFSAFTVGYSRFLIIPIIWMLIYDAINFDNIKKGKRYCMDIAYFLYLFFDCLSIGLVISFSFENPDRHSSVAYYYERFIMVGLEMIFQVVCYVLFRIYMHKTKMTRLATYLAAAEFIIAGNVTIFTQGTVNVNNLGGGVSNIYNQTKIVERLKDVDDSFYRIFNPSADRGNANLGLIEGYTTLSLFNSNYTFSMQDFLDMSRIPYTYRNWSMGYHERRPTIDTMLSVKYYLLPESDNNIPYGFVDIEEPDSYTKFFLDGKTTYDDYQELIDTLHEYNQKLYINENFVSLLFPFDNYSRFETLPTYSKKNDKIMNTSMDELYYEKYYLTTALLYDESFFSLGDDVWSGVLGEHSSMSDSTIPTLHFRNMDEIGLSPKYYLFRSKYNPDNNTVNICGGDLECQNRYEISSDFAYNGQTIEKTNSAGLDLYVSKFGIDQSFEQVEVNATSVPKDNYKFRTKILIDFSETPIPAGYINFETSHNWKVSFFGMNSVEDFATVYDKVQQDEAYAREMYPTITSGGYSYSDYHLSHGYYLYEPAYYVVLELVDTINGSAYEIGSNDLFSYLPYDELQVALDNFQNDSTVIHSRTSDRIEFSTFYDKSKIVMINIPYSEGWTLTQYVTTSGPNSDGEIVQRVSESEVELFRMQGGFMGYFDKKNNSSADDVRYVLEYKPKMWSIAKLISMTGATLSALLYVYYAYTSSTTKIRENEMFSLKYSIEKSFNEKRMRRK